MILTDQEIEALWTGTHVPTQGEISRAIEAAVIAKLCTVEMPEPVAYAGRTQAGKWKYTTGSIGSAKTWLLYQEREYLAKGLQIVPLYTADQLRTVAAAARLKALEEAGVIATPLLPRPCDCQVCDCGNSGDYARVVDWDSSNSLAIAIRALKGTTP